MTTELMTASELEKDLDLLIAMASEDYDWVAFYSQDIIPDIPDLFRRCFQIPSADEHLKAAEVGSSQLDNTPDSLYRLLFLLRPEKINFSDMYKSRLMRVASFDRKYLITVELYKYELAAYFYVPKGLIRAKEGEDGPSGIVSGMPGDDNGWETTDPLAIKFFETFVMSINREWMVYGGYDFTV